MASTVNNAFSEFLRDTVNLDPDETKTARGSRDWLKGQINCLPDRATSFPFLVNAYHLDYGSFARRTKIRPLNDIDLLIGLNAQQSTYVEYSGHVEVYAGPYADRLKLLCYDGTNTVNSIKVLNQFKAGLSKIDQYKKADLKLNHQATVLNLSSYDWSFDIVPSFMTAEDEWGRSYYLIPNGKGHWMKTDPRIDQALTTSVNQKHSGNVLNVLRLVKFWTKRPITATIPSYLLETIIFNYYDNKTSMHSWPDMEIPGLLEHIARTIQWTVNDPKGIQGDINRLTYDERSRISKVATDHAAIAWQARQYEDNSNHRASIGAWQRVFGPLFPDFY